MQDVVITNACSGALLMCFEVLCDPGSTVLIPSPGFGLYKCHADALGVHTKAYRLMVREPIHFNVLSGDFILEGARNMDLWGGNIPWSPPLR